MEICAVTEMLTHLTCPAPAKLNLFLHVTGRRADGYHLLQTVFRFIDFADTLHFGLRTDAEIRHLNPLPGVPADSDLTVRAARLLQAETGCSFGVDIRIDKHLPMGGGLGGGSSDAATTLIALNRMWQLGLSRERLQQLGLSLGADVPVFVFGRNAFAEGVGEALTHVNVPSPWYVVLMPQVEVPTAKIFAAEALTRNTLPIRMAAFPDVLTRNDLQPVVCEMFPQVQQSINWLSQFAEAKMTGSGACVFAEFDSQQSAQSVLESAPAEFKGVVARGLDQHPMLAWLS
ncbi:MAG: 4-(cytidine 5'-diphospho)-2-C-methyl-D-erythritol kinase [Neisseriaceae bacterium]|jgi:4-diphosphocytidyl-2-C-methyl-D-erythritol kinase|nr:MAG: 4-(cytidine 5'-diphospho)-2-C-methyl-D-erythritol kinase [Neisseriaceae bacterium]